MTISAGAALLRPRVARAQSGGCAAPLPLLRHASATVVACAAFLAGCAPLSSSTSAQASPAPTAAEATDPLPNNDLDARTFYQLLMAELQAQHGHPDIAFADEWPLAQSTRDPRLARRATEFALMAHQTRAAEAAAQLWHDEAPHSEEAEATLLTILVLSDKLPQAEPLIADLVAHAPDPAAALGQSAATLARAANHAEALAVMRQVAAGYPQLPEAHLAVAQTALNAGDTATSVTEARAAAALHPDQPNSTIMSAQLLQTEAPAEAEGVLEQYLRRHSDSLEVRMAYARFLIGQKRYPDASKEFEKILAARPHDTDTLYALGLLAYQAERPHEAEKYFKRFIALSQHPDDHAAESAQELEQEVPDEASDDASGTGGSRSVAAAYLYLAQIAEDRRDYAQALKDLDRVEPGQEWLGARLRHAMILGKMGQVDAARAELHGLPVKTDRDKTSVLLTEAEILREAGKNSEAYNLDDEALKSQPDNPDVLYDLAMTAEKLNRIDVMEELLRKVMKLQPDNAQAYNALGYTFADRNIRLDEARQLIEKALSLAPDDASIIDSLGWVKYRQGDTAGAIENLERAYRLRGDAEIAVHLGEVLWVSGRRADAERYWKEAGHKEPDNEVLRATLARFNVSIGAI